MLSSSQLVQIEIEVCMYVAGCPHLMTIERVPAKAGGDGAVGGDGGVGGSRGASPENFR